MKTLEDGSQCQTKSILKKVHHAHLKLKDFVEGTSRVYSVVNFFQLFYSSAFICVSIYIFATAPTGKGSLKTLVPAIAAMTQPVAYCFFGQHLTNKFEQLYINILEVRWYHFKGEEKLSYLIMLQNMQQPIVVRTPFNELSVVVFRNVR